jgi:hypothetical protein
LGLGAKAPIVDSTSAAKALETLGDICKVYVNLKYTERQAGFHRYLQVTRWIDVGAAEVGGVRKRRVDEWAGLSG